MDTAAILYQMMLNKIVLSANAKDISHAESIKEPQPGGNSMNWVVGHIVRTRNNILGLVGNEPLFPAEKFDMYSGYLSVTFDSAKAISFDELLKHHEALQEPLVEALRTMDIHALRQPAPFSPLNDPNETIGSLLVGIMFHEAYHLGQTALLRRLLGKPGAIKAQEREPANSK